MVFAVVSVALIWKRLYNRDLTFKQQQYPFWLITAMVLASIGECTLNVLGCWLNKWVALRAC
jgi:hypothetical protein